MLHTQDAAVDVVRRNLHALQDAEHHHTRRLFITVPGVERGEVQISEPETKRFARYYLIGSAALDAMGKPMRHETTVNDFSADW